MGFNVDALSTYTKQLTEPLLSTAVFGAKTQQIILDGGIVIPKAKSVVAIPIMETQATFQTNACGFNSVGTTTMSQATITVGNIKVQESICLDTLESYFYQEAMKQGSVADLSAAPALIEAYLAKKNALIAGQLETALWQGDSGAGTGSPNLNKFNGLAKFIEAGSPVDANVSNYNGATGAITALTSGNIIAATEACYKALPAQVASKGDATIFVGYDWYRSLILAYREKNMFSYNPQDAGAQSFILPGTSVTVQPVNGLNGTYDAYAMSISNMALAVDLVSDEENYRIRYDESNEEVRFTAKFKIGVGVGFTSECVKFKATSLA
jgi:hypothetical protein